MSTETPVIPSNSSSNKKKTKDIIIEKIILIWSYISVEPVILCWILPSCFLLIAVDNLVLEKSCRVNFRYRDEICDNMIDKTLNNFDCSSLKSRIAEANKTQVDEIHNLHDGHVLLNSSVPYVVNNLTNISHLEIEVCEAEVNSQKLVTKLNVYTAGFDIIFGVIMIIFAGGWCDRNGIRKPCIILPVIGELGMLIVLLITTIFMKELPLEFHGYLSKLLPAMSGGMNLMLMAVYSYLSETTKEEDRTFRFGIFAIFIPIVLILGTGVSSKLFDSLGYIKLIVICLPINIAGILYAIFVLKEVKHENPPVIEENGNQQNGIHSENNSSHNHLDKNLTKTKKRNLLIDFFNPIVAIEGARVIMKKRKLNGRATIIFILVAYFVASAPAFGEEPNEYNYTRFQLNWSILEYGPLISYSNIVALVGTMLMVSVLSKILKLSDPLIGVICVCFSSVSRILYVLAKTTLMIYAAKTVDMFISVRLLILRSVISTFVDASELGRIFSIIGIIEIISKYISVSIYSIVYEKTLETFPSAYYLLSFGCLVITGIMFAVLYFIVKRKHQIEALEKIELENIKKHQIDVEDHEKHTYTNNVTETSHM